MTIIMSPDERTLCSVPTCDGSTALAPKRLTDKGRMQPEKVPWGLGPPYRWCSARRSSRGCIRTCRRGRSRARHSVGGRPAGHRLPPSSHPRSDRCPPRRRRGHHSQQHRSLQGGGEGTQARTGRGRGRKRERKQVLSELRLGTRVTLGYLPGLL